MGNKTAWVDDGSVVGDANRGESRRIAYAIVVAAVAAGLGSLLAVRLVRWSSHDRLEAHVAVPSIAAQWPVPRPQPAKVADGVTRIDSPEGRLVVQYRVQVDPSTTTGSTLNGVTAIEFHPGYITVIRGDGGGQTFFADRTKEFTWSMSGPTDSH
jgi:hypothetical protein